jgi:hypothetical protein
MNHRELASITADRELGVNTECERIRSTSRSFPRTRAPYSTTVVLRPPLAQVAGRRGLGRAGIFSCWTTASTDWEPSLIGSSTPLSSREPVKSLGARREAEKIIVPSHQSWPASFDLPGWGRPITASGLVPCCVARCVARGSSDRARSVSARARTERGTHTAAGRRHGE